MPFNWMGHLYKNSLLKAKSREFLLSRFISYKFNPKKQRDLKELQDETEKEEKEAESHEKFKRIIQRKRLFGEPKDLPEFLSYLAKQQIIYLSMLDPHKYSHEFMIQHYPIYGGMYYLKKMISTNHKLRSLDAIKAHDQTITHNWGKLIKGEFDRWPSFSSRKSDQDPIFKIQSAGGNRNFSCPPLGTIINPHKNYIASITYPVKQVLSPSAKKTHSSSFLSLLSPQELRDYVTTNDSKFNYDQFEGDMRRHVDKFDESIKKLWVTISKYEIQGENIDNYPQHQIL